LKLDLGCGHGGSKPGWIGVDILDLPQIHVTHDLNHYPYPFESGCADKILAHHIVEHLDNPRLFFRECWRLLNPGGIVYVTTPHFSSRTAFGHAEHKNFNIMSYSFPDHLEREAVLISNWFNQGFKEECYFKVLEKHLKYRDCLPDRWWERPWTWFANLHPRFCERVWCYWVGGMGEVGYTLLKDEC